jgi:cytochrome c biogenesis protein CcmG/thiol:disulfide interchange protein DsbE
LLAFAALATALLVQLQLDRNPSEIPSRLVGRAVPAFDLPAISGGGSPGFSSADLKSGRPSLVNIWATWCGPCRIEHPLLMSLKARGFPVFGLLYRDSADKARAFLAELGDPFVKTGNDAKGLTGIDWGVTGVPETFVIDAKGVVIARHAGPLDEFAITKTILPLLGKQP